MSDQRAYMLPSARDDWPTPKALMDQIFAEFKPDLDPCGAREHHYSAWLIEHHGGRFMDGSTPALDGLNQPWHCRCFYMNPPFGEPEHPCRPKCKKKRCVTRGHHITEYMPGMSDWIKRGVGQIECGNAGMGIALLPARTDTRWWQEYVMQRVKEGHDVTNDMWEWQVDELTGLLVDVRFLPGRLKFGDAKNSAPFPSAIVVWGAAATQPGKEENRDG